jgi:hypothetical protein
MRVHVAGIGVQVHRNTHRRQRQIVYEGDDRRRPDAGERMGRLSSIKSRDPTRRAKISLYQRIGEFIIACGIDKGAVDTPRISQSISLRRMAIA